MILKILSYPLSILFIGSFFLGLIVFHPIQWFCFNVFGYSAHKKCVDIMNIYLMRCLHILGTRITLKQNYKIETQDRPLIIVSNHQSMFDISPLGLLFKKNHPKYVSKIELGKRIPSISYNLNHGGSVLIDRKNAKQSLSALMRFGKYIEKNKYAAIIFPEGTRSKDGRMKPFKTKGLEVLLKKIPSALIVPVTINNSWKIVRYGTFPMGLGNHLKITSHKPLELTNFASTQELIDRLYSTIEEGLDH